MPPMLARLTDALDEVRTYADVVALGLGSGSLVDSMGDVINLSTWIGVARQRWIDIGEYIDEADAAAPGLTMAPLVGWPPPPVDEVVEEEPPAPAPDPGLEAHRANMRTLGAALGEWLRVFESREQAAEVAAQLRAGGVLTVCVTGAPTLTPDTHGGAC